MACGTERVHVYCHLLYEWLLQVFWQDDCSKKRKDSVEMCWKHVVSLSCLFPKNKRRRNMNCSTRCFWKRRASWCVQKASEPPQCQLFRNQEKQLIFSITACYPKGLERVFNSPRCWTVFTPWDRTINKTLHLYVLNTKISKSWRWWDFLLNIWWMMQIFLGTKTVIFGV